MSFDRRKNASQWFYDNIYKDEAIRPRVFQAPEKLPSLLRTARSLENRPGQLWQSRESVFLKQGKLLAAYEDDYVFTGNVVRYFPTYEALSNPELRGYFSWRTKLRKGELQQTSLSFVFLYIYELLNQIGVADPQEGYRKLQALKDGYGQLDGSILPYLDRWMVHYAVYYELDRQLLEETPQVVYDKSISVLEHMEEHSTAQIMEAVSRLAPKWLSRSKFYSTNRQDMDTVTVKVLRRIAKHYSSCKKGLSEQYFGNFGQYDVQLFDTAVFCDPLKRRICEYAVDERCVYRCRNGHWTVFRHGSLPRPSSKLDAVVKTVDALMRQAFGYAHPIKPALDTKWLLKIIDEETRILVAEKEAAEKKKLKIDYSQLDKIRRDAAITREKLIVDEEEEEDAPPPEPSPAAPEPSDPEALPLEDAESRLLRCLLYGKDLSWIREEGYILSVLLDSINDKLYDVFLDTVVEDGPQVVGDYIDELKEMIKP